MRGVTGLLADVCCVLIFAGIGRASHSEGETLADLARTAWPFLSGLAVGWLMARAWRQPVAIVPSGVAAWLGTVSVGMMLRGAVGQGTAVPFVLVALVFLGLLMIGWRAAARLAAGPLRPR